MTIDHVPVEIRIRNLIDNSTPNDTGQVTELLINALVNRELDKEIIRDLAWRFLNKHQNHLLKDELDQWYRFAQISDWWTSFEYDETLIENLKCED